MQPDSDGAEFERLFQEFKEFKQQQQINQNIAEVSFLQWLSELALSADKSVDGVQLLIGKSMGINLNED